MADVRMAYARMLWQLQRARMAVAAGSYACCSGLVCLLQRAGAGMAVADALLSFRSTSVLTYADVWRMLTYADVCGGPFALLSFRSTGHSVRMR